MPLVNERLSSTTPRESLDYIGIALSHIMYAIAIAKIDTLCLFTKANIKDGFGTFLLKKQSARILCIYCDLETKTTLCILSS